MSQDYEKCEVIFPYTKVNNDELDLQRGQIVTILSKNLEDPGWWRGILNGKVGVFPDNFVKIIKNSSDKPPIKRVSSDENQVLDSLKNLKKELEESAKNDLSPSKKIQKVPSEETENPDRKSIKVKKVAQKKAAPSVPPAVVVTPEKEDIKLVEEELPVKDILDAIGSSAKLRQQTGGRVKPPGGRRPPSKLLLRENIPDLIDIQVDDEDGEEEEKEEKLEKAETQTGRPFKMTMMDISKVKLRTTKQTKVVRPITTTEANSPVPGWLEDLSKKQANRRSAGNSLDQNSPVEPPPQISPFSRNNALRKPATGTELKEDTKTEVIGWKTDLYNEENKISKEENTSARDDTKNIFNKEEEKNNEEVEITSLQKDMEKFKLQMLKEISSLKDELETERKSRQALEKEILELKQRI